MKGKTNKALLIALPLALAACGGGGGGDNPAADSNKPQAPKPEVNKTNDKQYGLTSEELKNIATSSQGLQGVSTFNGITMAGKLSEWDDTSLTNAEHVPPEYKNQVSTKTRLGTVFIPSIAEAAKIGEKSPSRIGGVEIYKGNKIYASGTSYQNFDYFLASNENKYNAVQFGIGKNGDATPIFVAYFRARTTPEDRMPTSGTASYRGDFIVPPDLLPAGANPVGTVAANVNFGSKDAAMLFTQPSGYQGDIRAKVVGSLLAGKDGKKEVIGIFGGGNASEIAGSYSDEAANIQGVYGAQRQ
jgi:hypothetical protein